VRLASPPPGVRYTPRRRSTDISKRVLVLSALVVLALFHPALARDPAYLDEFPDPQRVFRDIQGRDRLDTLARQLGALDRLAGIMVEMAGPRAARPGGYPNPDEQQIMDGYRAAAAPLFREVDALVGASKGPGSPRAIFTARHAAYRVDRVLTHELMSRFFSGRFEAAYGKAIGQTFDQEKYRSQERRNLRALRGEPETVWSRLSDEDQASALRYGAAMLLLMVLGLVREFGRFGFDRSDPRILKTGFIGRSRVDWATGILGAYREWTHHTERWMQVTSLAKDVDGARGGTSWTRYVTSYRHEVFTLASALGRQAVHLVNASKGRQEQELPTAFHDRSGRRVTAAWRTLLPAFGFGLILGRSTDLVNVAATKGLRGFVVGLIAAGLWFAVLLTIGAVRGRRFERNELPWFFTIIGDEDAVSKEPQRAPAAPKTEQERPSPIP
jgi:hypothetical protein